MQTQTMLSFALAGLVLASTIHAQTPVDKPADPPKATAPAPPPVLSDAEKGAIDVLALIAQRDAALKDLGTCTASLAPLQAQQRDAQLRSRVDALRQTIEKAHPGYRWDIEKGLLVPLSPPKVAVKP